MNKKEINCFDIQLFSNSKKDFFEFLETQMDSHKGCAVATVNPEFVMYTRASKHFLEILSLCDVRVIDGAGLSYAVFIQSKIKSIERITGFDIAEFLFKKAFEKKQSIHLIGGSGDAAKKTGEYFSSQFPSLDCTFSNPGFIEHDQLHESDFFEKFNYLTSLNPKILLIAFGQEKQECFMVEFKKRLPNTIMVGVGGIFDIYSGVFQRAPKVVRFFGLEWLFRFIQQPSRYKRIMNATIKFPFLVISDVYKKHGIFHTILVHLTFLIHLCLRTLKNKSSHD